MGWAQLKPANSFFLADVTSGWLNDMYSFLIHKDTCSICIITVECLLSVEIKLSYQSKSYGWWQAGTAILSRPLSNSFTIPSVQYRFERFYDHCPFRWPSEEPRPSCSSNSSPFHLQIVIIIGTVKTNENIGTAPSDSQWLHFIGNQSHNHRVFLLLHSAPLEYIHNVLTFAV